jgi:hypothetical protein
VKGWFIVQTPRGGAFQSTQQCLPQAIQRLGCRV